MRTVQTAFPSDQAASTWMFDPVIALYSIMDSPTALNELDGKDEDMLGRLEDPDIYQVLAEAVIGLSSSLTDSVQSRKFAQSLSAGILDRNMELKRRVDAARALAALRFNLPDSAAGIEAVRLLISNKPRAWANDVRNLCLSVKTTSSGIQIARELAPYLRDREIDVVSRRKLQRGWHR